MWEEISLQVAALNSEYTQRMPADSSVNIKEFYFCNLREKETDSVGHLRINTTVAYFPWPEDIALSISVSYLHSYTFLLQHLSANSHFLC